MKEIKLKVPEENVETLMSILQNLKSGLINSIEVDDKSIKKRATQYQPKANKVIKEEESGTHDKSGKYLDPKAFKEKLKRKKGF
jgi:hypothetical protein